MFATLLTHARRLIKNATFANKTNLYMIEAFFFYYFEASAKVRLFDYFFKGKEISDYVIPQRYDLISKTVTPGKLTMRTSYRADYRRLLVEPRYK